MAARTEWMRVQRDVDVWWFDCLLNRYEECLNSAGCEFATAAEANDAARRHLAEYHAPRHAAE